MTPKGVRMINNDVVQPGYSLVVTERDAERWPRENPDKFKQLPDGTLYINPTTGMVTLPIKTVKVNNDINQKQNKDLCSN